MQVIKLVDIKKIILLFLVIIMCSGCQSNIYYNFNDEGVESKIVIKYDSKEFSSYLQNIETGLSKSYSNDEVNTLSKNTFDSYKIKSFYYSDDLTYDGNLIQDNNNFTYEYLYNYEYENFKDNSIFNSCFEIKIINEDENSYYYSLSGKYTCRYVDGLQFIVKAKNRLVNTNSRNVSDDVAKWIIDQENNDIYFAIGKTAVIKNDMSNVYIWGGVVASVLLIITLFLYKKIENN